jgi:hypothetical protein
LECRRDRWKRRYGFLKSWCGLSDWQCRVVCGYGSKAEGAGNNLVIFFRRVARRT